MRISFGPVRKVDATSDQFPTVGALLADRNVRAVLGYPESVDVYVNGSVADMSQRLEDDDGVEFITKANKKG